MKTTAARKIAVIALVLMIVGLAVYFLQGNYDGKEKPEEPVEVSKTLKFFFEIRNESNRAINDAKFSAYLPVESTTQRKQKIKSSVDYEVETGESFNRVLHATFGLIPPYGAVKFSYSVEVLNAQSGAKQVDEDFRKYLVSEKFMESDHPKIIANAKSLKRNSDFDTAKAIYDWVVANVKDAGYTSQDKGALYALQNKRGDCTEYMYLVIALARAAGLPARPVGGYVYLQNTIVEPADYHNWAELYFDGHWYTVDAQKKAFRDKTGTYVAMRYLSEKKPSLLGNSHRFSVADDFLDIKMLK